MILILYGTDREPLVGQRALTVQHDITKSESRRYQVSPSHIDIPHSISRLPMIQILPICCTLLRIIVVVSIIPRCKSSKCLSQMGVGKITPGLKSRLTETKFLKLLKSYPFFLCR